MDVTVHAPEKKKHAFLAKLSTFHRPSHNKPGKQAKVKLRMDDVNIVHVAPMNSSEARYILKVLLLENTPEIQRLFEIDERVKNETKVRNGNWFKNSLDENTIDTLFRQSIHPTNRNFTVLLSETNDPTIYIDGKLVEGTDAVFVSLNDKTLLRDRQVDIEIEAQGLCFYPQKFGVRWIISKLSITSLNVDSNDSPDIDKHSIEQCWESDIRDLSDRIDQDIAVLNAHIHKLNEEKRAAIDNLNSARQVPCSDPIWNENLKALSMRCKSYYNGSS